MMWEFDVARRVIELVFRQGSAEPVSARVPVCSPYAPRWNAHPVIRVDGERWRLLACRFEDGLTEVGRGTARMLLPQPYPIAPQLTAGDHIILCGTPPDVDQELDSL